MPAKKSPTKKSPTKKSPAKKTAKKKTVTVDRRKPTADGRRKVDRREKPTEVKVERREGERREKVNRRRQIDPTTCERDYTDNEVEFMQAMDEYKRKNGRMFPTCSEILEVIREMGYVRMPKGESLPEANPADAQLAETVASEDIVEDAITA